MSQKVMFASAILAFSTTIAVSADTRLEIRSTEAGQQPESQAVMITSGKVRMEQSREEETVLLYHQSDNTFYAIQPKEKSYMVIDPAMMERVSQMQQQMMKQLEEQMAQMPEEQREQMKAMMAQRGQGMPQTQPENVRYQARGDGGSAAGISCKWYDAYEGSRKVRELCIASPGAIGMAGSDRDTMMGMMKAIQAFAARFGGDSMFVDEMPDGFPIRVRHLNEGGQLASEQEVSNVSSGSLDASLFEVPSGYQRQEMPMMHQ